MRNVPRKIIVAITGASGSIYARQLIQNLLKQSNVEGIALIHSKNGKEVADFEGEQIPLNDSRIRIFSNDDMFAAPASGSAGYDAMIIVPCSMGSVGRIASGISDNLITRAADVMIKERRVLIIVPRETPYSTIHLRNLTTISECGGIVVPASPSFYSLPKEIEQLCMTVTERILSLLGFNAPHYQWGCLPTDNDENGDA